MRKLLPVLLAMGLCFQVNALAQARNTAQISKNKIVKARPLPLNDVRLLGGPLKIAQDLDAKYLLELEPDRMLSFLRLRAGLNLKRKVTVDGMAPAGNSQVTLQDTTCPL